MIDDIAARFRGLLHQHHRPSTAPPAPHARALRSLAAAVVAVGDDLGPHCRANPEVDQAQTDLYLLADEIERVADRIDGRNARHQSG